LAAGLWQYHFRRPLFVPRQISRDSAGDDRQKSPEEAWP